MHTQTHISRRSVIAAAGALAATSTVRGTGAAVGAQAQVPIVIVGTGYGASVTALRLAQAGQHVVMLEMGQDWRSKWGPLKRYSGMLPPDSRSMWFRTTAGLPIGSVFNVPVTIPTLPYAGVLDLVKFGGIDVFVGRGVGGGSIVNGALVARPERAFLAAQLPQIDMKDFFARHLPLASAGIGATTIRPEFFQSTPYYRYAREALASWRRAGFTEYEMISSCYDYAYMEQEAAGRVPKSALATEVAFGNNYGKQELGHTYLKLAQQTGRVEIRPLHEVVRITPRPGGGYRLVAKRITDLGIPLPSATIECRKLILACGSLGTSQLLLQAQAEGTLPGLSDQLGTRWGNNGNIMFARNSATPVGAQQATIPALGLDNRHDPSAPVYFEAAPLPLGLETKMSVYLGNTQTPERARLSWQRSGGLRNSWRYEQSAKGIADVRRVMDKVNAVEKTTYRNDLFGSFANKVFSDHAAHPLGGVPLGVVTDDWGRVKGLPDLYVNDGSLIPGAVGVNPMLTIAALAERNIERLIGAGDFA